MSMRAGIPNLRRWSALAATLALVVAGCGSEEVRLYSAASLRPAVAEAVEAFTAETGIAVETDYAGSGTLISKIRASKQGDLYMPAADEYIERAEELGLIESHHNVCYFVPVILVQKGNPKGIRTLADLARPGLRLALGNPEVCAIGRAAEKLFEKNGVAVDPRGKDLAYSSATVNELGVQIKAQHVDATIVWDTIGAYYPDSADVVAIPPEQNLVSAVSIALLRSSKHPEAAARFVDFLTSDEGKAILRKHHYTTELPGR